VATSRVAVHAGRPGCKNAAMTAASPAEAFLAAQQAMIHGDWEGFFRRLTRRRLVEIAVMVIPMVGDDPAGTFSDLCRRHGIPADLLADVRDLGDEIVRSAERFRGDDGRSPAEMVADSDRHRLLVKEHARAAKACVDAITDVAAFVAASERHRRETSGGGSISSRMFVDETLTEIVVTGRKATGVRTFPHGRSEGLAFVFERGEWRIGGATRR
jgi:hypothetical protein